MRFLTLLMVLVCTLQGRAPRAEGPGEEMFRVERGGRHLPVLIPRGEELAFRVMIDVGILGTLEAGKVTLSSGVERYIPGLPRSDAEAQPPQPVEMGWIRSVATGSYAGYSLKHELLARHLPQAWPTIYYTDTQTGSESRRRELRLGRIGGAEGAEYRHDGHCKGCDNAEHFIQSKWLWGKPSHCSKCKGASHRTWREAESRAIPDATVDMLTAVYVARSMVMDGRKETTFALVDRRDLWTVHLTRGPRSRIATPAGRFECVRVELRTEVPAGETLDEDQKGFEGLFGLRGTIRIWMEERSGVPVRIQGQFPVPVLGDLDVAIELVSHSGTPAGFGN